MKLRDWMTEYCPNSSVYENDGEANESVTKERQTKFHSKCLRNKD